MHHNYTLFSYPDRIKEINKFKIVILSIPGANVIKKLMLRADKLQCLSLASLYSLVESTLVSIPSTVSSWPRDKQSSLSARSDGDKEKKFSNLGEIEQNCLKYVLKKVLNQ
jgi:hypothetical protein